MLECLKCDRSEVAALASIAASRNDGDYRRVSRVVTTYRVRHEQRTFLLGNKWPQAPFSFSVSLITPRINRWALNDSRGYKKKACRGLFRDHGNSFDFREEHEESRSAPLLHDEDRRRFEKSQTEPGTHNHIIGISTRLFCSNYSSAFTF